jgi:glyceraldehyde 3-phosphate dehydrogenase
MAVKIAINGFGRIGRLVLRALAETGRTDLTPVLIKDLGKPEANAHLFAYDSVHGRFPGEVAVEGESIRISYQGKTLGPIRVLAEPDPSRLPLQGVDVVLECTGHFRKRHEASKLLSAGARKVIVSAPAEGADATIVYGVNHETLNGGMKIISGASCTTNCLAPVAYVLERSFGIVHGYMVTVHSYTGDQRLVDTLHKDLHRARAAALSMIPTTTGAAKAIGLVLPSLAGRLDGVSVRVPTPNVSLVSLDVVTRESVTVEKVNAAMEAASRGELRNILDYNTAPLVSSDFNHCSASSTFDATQTAVVDGNFVHVLAWYDNEWGFSNRMLDTAARFGSL